MIELTADQVNWWQIIESVATAVAALGAIYFGFIQTKINKRLQKLEDFVAVSFVPNNDSIKILNTGKINVYIKSFTLGQKSFTFDKPRMIPANAGDSSYYWIEPDGIPINGEFIICLYLLDEFGKKFKAAGGGWVESKKVDQEENKFEVKITVWTNECKTFNWNL
jgi:hypothetical protein